MFNKAVRKISIALNTIVEDKEKQSLLSDEKRRKAEQTVERMKDVARQTLEEDVTDAAHAAMETLHANDLTSLPPEIATDPELMRYVVKGSKKQWDEALQGRDLKEGSVGTVRIQSTREKRKAVDDEAMQRETVAVDRNSSSGFRKSGKKKKKSKKSRQ
jgi:N-acetyltransferase 10